MQVGFMIYKKMHQIGCTDVPNKNIHVFFPMWATND